MQAPCGVLGGGVRNSVTSVVVRGTVPLTTLVQKDDKGTVPLSSKKDHPTGDPFLYTLRMDRSFLLSSTTSASFPGSRLPYRS